jgi:RNA polymerase sigma-70 factor (ECF subfamily)
MPAPAASEADAGVALLYDCIARLSATDRSVISLYLEDLPPADIAEVLGISEGNLRVKLHRIRKKIRTLMEENGHDA